MLVLEVLEEHGVVRFTRLGELVGGVSQKMLMSRGTQIPEYVLRGCLTAFKSRNPPSCLYSNPGPKLMHAKSMVASLYLYPGQTSA
jgi:hypothetical protein